MFQILTMLGLKIITLIAATAQTAGFIGLFAIDALQPYKWKLLIGGTIAIICSEGLAYLLAKQMAKTDDN